MDYQLELSGAGGGDLAVRVDDGRVDVGPGRLPAPDVIYRLAAADFFGVLAGRANADMLFLGGRLRVEGDLALALKLRALFGAPA